MMLPLGVEQAEPAAVFGLPDKVITAARAAYSCSGAVFPGNKLHARLPAKQQFS
jgi:hypothetical protein